MKTLSNREKFATMHASRYNVAGVRRTVKGARRPA